MNPAELPAHLDEAGTDGWELVNVFTTSQSEGSTRDVLAVLE